VLNSQLPSEKQAPQDGVTLIELIVTVVVVGILSAIAVPSFLSFLQKQRVVGAASSLSSMMSFARAESLKRDEKISLTISVASSDNWCFGLVASASSCDCSSGATSNKCEIDGANRRDGSNQYPAVLAAVTPASTTATLTYDPVRGTVSSTPAIRFSIDSDISLEIQTTKLGRAYQCKPSGSALGGYKEC